MEISCADPTKLSAWAEADLLEAIDTVVEAHRQRRDGRITKAELTSTCQTYGFKVTEGGLLADERLRAVIQWTKTFRYDWVHTFLSNGIVTAALWNLVSLCEQASAIRSAGNATRVRLFRKSERPGKLMFEISLAWLDHLFWGFPVPPVSSIKNILASDPPWRCQCEGTRLWCFCRLIENQPPENY